MPHIPTESDTAAQLHDALLKSLARSSSTPKTPPFLANNIASEGYLARLHPARRTSASRANPLGRARPGTGLKPVAIQTNIVELWKTHDAKLPHPFSTLQVAEAQQEEPPRCHIYLSYSVSAVQRV